MCNNVGFGFGTCSQLRGQKKQIDCAGYSKALGHLNTYSIGSTLLRLVSFCWRKEETAGLRTAVSPYNPVSWAHAGSAFVSIRRLLGHDIIIPSAIIPLLCLYPQNVTLLLASLLPFIFVLHILNDSLRQFWLASRI